jgi:hypothetical protein
MALLSTTVVPLSLIAMTDNPTSFLKERILSQFKEAMINHISPSLIGFPCPKGVPHLQAVVFGSILDLEIVPKFLSNKYTGLFNIDNTSISFIYDEDRTLMPVIDLDYDCIVQIQPIVDLFAANKQFFDFVENRQPVFNFSTAGLRLLFKAK